MAIPVTPASSPEVYDMHCHLDFAGNACELAAQATAMGLGAFSTTVDPRDFIATSDLLAPWGTVRVGLGLHPWWLADGRCGPEEVALFAELARSTHLIGEVGLDFSPRREGTFNRQQEVFAQLMKGCAGGGRLISIHAVRSATTVLDILEGTDALSGNTVVLHWFSGTSDELQRAVSLGCCFSIGTRMLATKRGRAYARALPCDRLLLESDLPDNPTPAFSFDVWHTDLVHALEQLAQARNLTTIQERADLQGQVARNSRRAWNNALW